MGVIDIKSTKLTLNKYNIVTRHWRGEFPPDFILLIIVPLTYACHFFIINFLSSIVSDLSDLSHTGLHLVFNGILTPLFQLWFLIGLWRSASFFRPDDNKPKIFSIIIKLVSVGLFLISAYMTVNVYSLYISSGVESLRDYSGNEIDLVTIETSVSGSEIYYDGRIVRGSSAKLVKVLDNNPRANTLYLNSPGGLIAESLKLAKIVRDVEMTIIVENECSSACTIVLINGTIRLMTPEANIGFHSAFIGDRSISGTNSALKIELKKYGISDEFIEKAVNTPSNNMWYPSHKVLKQEGIVNAVLE